jgi:iron complex outermembrane receptor protein
MSRKSKMKSARARTAWVGLPLVTSASVALAQQAPPAANTLEEITVTATRREETLQSVPLAVQAITNERIEALHIQNFNDYAKFLPSVSFQTAGPGYARVLIRGISADHDPNHSGPQPTVGTYLDDQPITTIQGAIDLHLYDIARIEALAGPQGTLYGASSESGTVRIITNKPDPSAFQAAYDVQGSYMAHGGPGGTVEGFVNMPLSDRAAVRLVGWDEHTSGFIDNVPATRTYAVGGTINNSTLAKKHYNDVDVYGGRAALRVDMNDSWTITPVLMAQETKTTGVFGFDPAVGDLQVKRFHPDSTDDHFVDAALTIEGKVSDFDITYTGAFLKRQNNTQSDYSDYTLAYQTYASYAQLWVGPNNARIDPSQEILGKDRFEKVSQELRFATPKQYPIRAVGGVFYQRQQHQIERSYVIAGLDPLYSIKGWKDTWWLTEQMRVDRDYAAFAELSYDILPNLTVTGGFRQFKYDNTLAGFTGLAAGNPIAGTVGENGCISPVGIYGGPCLSFDKASKDTGNTHKLNVTYRLDDSKLVYATWSTGFRPGGINRAGNLPPYQADFLTNVELGWKMTFANAFRINAAIFHEDWKDFQFGFRGANNLTRIANAGAAQVWGIESDLSWSVTPRVLLTSGLTVMNPTLKDNYCGRLNPDGSPMTSNPCKNPNGSTSAPLAPQGQQLPSTSKVKANVTARYTFPVGTSEGHVLAAALYQSAQWDDLRTAQRTALGQQPGYATVDLTMGADRGNFSMDLFVTNLFDKRGEIFRYSQCSSCGPIATYIVPIQPRVVGLRFGQKF